MRVYLLQQRCETPLQYFKLYWSDYVAALLDSDNINVRLDSPRRLFHEIMSEIQYNHFKNADNIAYFHRQLSEWYKKDPVLKSLAGVDIQNALAHHFKEKQQQILFEICKKTVETLDEKNYTDQLFDKLTKFLEDNAEVNKKTKESIRIYTQLIIAEFASKGYDLNDIKDLARDIPGVIRVAGGEVVSAPDTFFELRRDQYDSRETYLDAVRNRFENRNVSESIIHIREEFHKEPVDAKLIIRLSYIRGINEVSIDDVVIYSPAVKKYITQPSLSDVEKMTPIQSLCAAIPVKYIGDASAIKAAKRKMDKMLEMLSIFYNEENVITYDMSHYCILEGEKILSESISSSEENTKNADNIRKYASSLDLEILCKDKETITKFYTKLQNHHDAETVRRLNNALHWCRNANAAVSNEERLLNSWFAIEGLLTVSDDIRECISQKSKGKIDEIKSIIVAILGPVMFQDKCLPVYRNILWRLEHQHWFSLQDDLKIKAGLSLHYGDNYRKTDFIRCAEELSMHVDDEILKDELQEVATYYSSIKEYDKEIVELQDGIQNVYRYRNFIVHNALVPIDDIQFFARKIYHIGRYVIAHILVTCMEDDCTIEEALLRFTINYEGFYAQLPIELQKIKQNK